MAKRCFVLLVLLCMALMIIGAQFLAIAREIPKSPYYPNSNEDWWQYQFDGYPDYTNNNCGPASSAMVINYLKGKGVTTTYHALISATYPNLHCHARWDYCRGNGHPNGYANSDWSVPGATTAQIRNALSSESIQTHTFTGYDCYNDGRGITNLQNAIDQGKVCICLVDPSCYRSTTCHSHWVVAYGYDNSYIYLNDPGYRTGQGFKASKSAFADALWEVTELSTVIVSDTKLYGNNPPNQPTDLWQFKSDGVTGIPVGGTTDESTVVLKGGVSDPDTDDARLQIELRRLDEYGGSFIGTVTHESGWVSSGSRASITVFGLINGDYHWRGRTMDSNGATSSWLSAGGNPDSAIDFTVSVSDTTPPSAPTISSSTHPNENNWYSNNDPSFSWTTPSDASGIAGYSYTIDHSSSTTPDTSVDTTGNSMSYSNLSDGTWYFHVRAKDNAGNWGSADHYLIKIDTAGPSSGTISINNGASSTNSLIVSLNSLSATDNLSGMGSGAQMKFSNDNSSWSSPVAYSNTYNNWNLSEYGGNTSAGTKTVYVRYKDVAGNWSSSFQDTINYQPDTTPPTPNPMTWATEPYETSTSSIAMVATTASDSSTPIYYYFDFYSSSTGGSGGTDSDWQTSTSYTDSALQANHQYSYRVKARDSSSNQNTTSYSSLSYEYTDIENPSGISFTNIATNSIQAKSSNTPSGLTRGSSGLIIENITKGTNSGWKQNNNFWTSSSLAINTSYGFRAKAKNGDGNETSYCATTYKYTLCTTPPAPAISNATSSSLDVNVNRGDNPSYTEFAIYNETGLYYVNASGGNNGSTPVWRTDANWSLVTVTGLSSGTTYSFKVKARNGDNTETSFSLAGSGTTSGPLTGDKIAVIKNKAGDYNLYIYSPPSSGAARSTWISTDKWTIPGGNNVIAMTAGDFNSSYSGDEIAVIKNKAGDYNLYIYSPPSSGANRSTWVSTDYWTVPSGNNVIAMTAGDFNSSYSGDEIAVIKNKAGDYNLYIYSPPSSGANRSTWVSTDYWTIPGGNNVVAMTAGDFNSDYPGDEIAVIKNKAGDYNLYIYSPPSSGANRSTWVSTDYWTVPSGNNVIAMTAGDFNSSYSGDEIAVIKNKAGDYNLYIYSPPSSGAARSTWVSTDYWTIPGGNNTVDIAGLVLDSSSASIAQAGTSLEIQDLHNYPNPTRDGRTIITYRLNSEPDKVRIEIFNVAGRLVRVIENAPSSSGLNEYLWDGKDKHGEMVANGVYFYRLTAWQGTIEIRKFNKLAVIR